jgi:hypothetical protein
MTQFFDIFFENHPFECILYIQRRKLRLQNKYRSFCENTFLKLLFSHLTERSVSMHTMNSFRIIARTILSTVN